MSRYGLWEFGNGTGNYSPATPNERKESNIVDMAVRAAGKKYKKAIYQRKISGGSYQRAGLPDVYLALAGGINIWVEFKRPGADTTALQKSNLENFKALGIYCGTAESTETYLKIIGDVLSLESIKHPMQFNNNKRDA
jgi:hypothetical protein